MRFKLPWKKHESRAHPPVPPTTTSTSTTTNPVTEEDFKVQLYHERGKALAPLLAELAKNMPESVNGVELQAKFLYNDGMEVTMQAAIGRGPMPKQNQGDKHGAD